MSHTHQIGTQGDDVWKLKARGGSREKLPGISLHQKLQMFD
jgi:hypothetical protein